jgi:hypothetical protein
VAILVQSWCTPTGAGCSCWRHANNTSSWDLPAWSLLHGWSGCIGVYLPRSLVLWGCREGGDGCLQCSNSLTYNKFCCGAQCTFELVPHRCLAGFRVAVCCLRLFADPCWVFMTAAHVSIAITLLLPTILHFPIVFPNSSTTNVPSWSVAQCGQFVNFLGIVAYSAL